MGEVYRARDERLGRDVAIKILPPELAGNPERLKRFEREARAASSLNHPNIVTIHEIGSADGTAYIVMELVDGDTLRSETEQGPVPTRKLLAIAAQIADGLARAHASGVMHRDLKPDNVMVTRGGVVKILDFGLAKLAFNEDSAEDAARASTASIVTEAGVVMGTAAYMSPEQARGAPVDFRSDQFSLGAVLYEMATGERAFAGDSRAGILSAILRDEPAPVASRNPKVPAPLRWIIERCLGKEPRERYASTDDLARDLATVRDRLSETTRSGPLPAEEPGKSSLLKSLQSAAIPLAALGLGLVVGWFALRPPPPSTPRFARVTFRPSTIYTGAFGPDGQTVLYGARVDDRPVEIFMTRLGSRESRPLGISPASVWSVSASGEMAVLMSADSGAGTLGRVSITGGRPREILENVGWADWSPNGQDLAVSRTVDEKSRIEFPIGHVLCEGCGGRIRVSPKADLVAEGGPSLGTVDMKGKRRELAKDVREYLWLPGGDELWFSRFGVGTTEIFAVTPRGRERFVTSLPGDFTLFDLSKEKRLLVERGNDRFDVAARFPGDAQDREFAWHDATVPADLSGDGNVLLFSEKELGWNEAEVYLRRTDGSPAVHLGKGFSLALSPDGKSALVLPSSPSTHLVVIPTRAGETRTLPNEGLEPLRIVTSGAGWLPDGKSIVFTASALGHQPRLWVQDVSGGMPRPITAEGVRIMHQPDAVSPDGKWVFANASEEYRLYPIGGGTPRPIPGLKETGEPVRWSADGGSLYVIDSHLKIWLFDVATGKKTSWRELHPPKAMTAVDFFFALLTPDGQSYVHTYQRWFSDLYVVEGLR